MIRGLITLLFVLLPVVALAGDKAAPTPAPAKVLIRQSHLSKSSPCQNGPAGPLCECHLEFPEGCVGEDVPSTMPCSSAGVVMPMAGSCNVKEDPKPAEPGADGEATATQASGQKIVPAEGTWVCGPHVAKLPSDVARLQQCQEEVGHPYCSCALKFKEGCGVEASTAVVVGPASIQSCKLGEGISFDATCPTGGGTGKAVWQCISLDPSERVATCTCTLEIKATDVCRKCNGGKDPSPIGQCARVSDVDTLVLENSVECGLQDTYQKASMRCPEETTSANGNLSFNAKWRCYSR